MRTDGKLTNLDGEFIASGPCEVDAVRREVTMWPAWEVHMLERQRSALRLELDDGTRLEISDKHLTFKLHAAAEQRTTVYRLRIIEQVPAHLTAGYVEDASDDVPPVGPADPETVRADGGSDARR